MKTFFTRLGWSLGVAVLCSLSAYGQAITEWDRSYGGDGTDLLRSISMTPDGGYLLGGHSTSDASRDKSEDSHGEEGKEDYWVVKIDADGNKEWDRTIGGNSIDYLRSAIALEDGGYLLAGNSFSGVSGDKTEPIRQDSDYWAVRVDAAGSILWDRSFGSIGFNALRDAVATDDGGFLLAGLAAGSGGDRSGPPSQNWDYWVVKIDADGNKEWDRAIIGSATDYPQAVTKGADGGFLIGGFSASEAGFDKTEAPKGYTEHTMPNGETISLPNNDYWVVKLDSNGNIMWDRTIGGELNEHLNAIEATADGGFLLGGYSNSNASADKTEDRKGELSWHNDYWIVKIDAEGAIEWDKTIGGSESETLVDLQSAAGGGYVLAGNSTSPASGDKTAAPEEGQRIWLVWVDEAGNIEQDQALGSGGAFLSSIVSPSDHHYLVGGTIPENQSDPYPLYDFYVQKIVNVVHPGETTPPAPTAGHLIGGGRIHSPAGAFPSDPLATGRAIFAFKAQHKTGAEAARGSVVFTFSEARLSFFSRNIDWLSVDENRAFIRGSGKIGRDEGYQFLISVVDQGQGRQAAKDRFRMIIWDEADNIVYDNQPGAAPYEVAEQAIQSGNILIHQQQEKTALVYGRERYQQLPAEALEGLSIYPTQLSHEGLWLEFPPFLENSHLQLVIYDMQGRKMATKSIETGTDGSKQHWKPAHENWASGIYLLKIQSPELKHQLKLIK